MTIGHRGVIAFIALLVGGAGAAWAADTPDAIELQFTTSLQRVQAKQPDLPDSPELKAYAIYDYLQAERLRRDVSLSANEDLDSQVDAFLVQHSGQPVIRALRRDWLVSLAARQRWDLFLPRSVDVNDPAVICLRLAGQLVTGVKPGLQDAALARWRLPQAQPPECDVVFGWLRQQTLLTPALAEERTRAALAADNWRLAKDFVNDVPAPQNAPLLQWIRLLQSPRPELTELARDPALAVEPRALLAGFARLTLTDYQTATTLLPALQQRTELTDEIRGQLQRSVALGGAYARVPDAVAAFERIPATLVDTSVQEWRARAALWAGDFGKALSWIEQMPPELAALPRWRFWRARALEQTAGPADAKPLYAELAKLRDYYGYLAADRIHHKYELNSQPLRADPAVQKSLAADEGLIRARALFDCDLYDEATVEWAVAMANADATTKTQAAILASRWGWYAQSIAMQAQLGSWDDVRLRYPRPFESQVARAARQTRIAGDWIYAVIRQESLFRPRAVSSAGARGLMQVLPSTATALAKRWKVALPSRDALFEPGPATILGSAHLRELLDSYGGSLPLSLAAYNAGSVPVARWLPSRTLDADIWIENISYNETRSYVQRVLEHVVAFAWVRKAPLPHLSTMMPPVTAASR
jgi:soluble lytic murein transglycosylase